MSSFLPFTILYLLHCILPSKIRNFNSLNIPYPFFFLSLIFKHFQKGIYFSQFIKVFFFNFSVYQLLFSFLDNSSCFYFSMELVKSPWSFCNTSLESWNLFLNHNHLIYYSITYFSFILVLFCFLYFLINFNKTNKFCHFFIFYFYKCYLISAIFFPFSIQEIAFLENQEFESIR